MRRIMSYVHRCFPLHSSHSRPPGTWKAHGVSYCAVCDAFFYRGKDVAVLGSGEYAMHEAGELLPVVGSVTILTNGAELTGVLPEGASWIPGRSQPLRATALWRRSPLRTAKAWLSAAYLLP